MTLPFIANVFSVYAARRERTQYKITAYIARVNVREGAKIGPWATSSSPFALTLAPITQITFPSVQICCKLDTVRVIKDGKFNAFRVDFQITKALKNIRNAIKMDMNQSLYLNLLALVLSSQKKVGIC